MNGDIVETLRRLCSAHGSIAEAIKSKGVTVPTGSGFEDFPGLIAKISASGETPTPPDEGGEFPAEPTAYNLIDTYTSSGTFTAPDNGWYQIEVHGASGKGGTSSPHDYDDPDNEGMQEIQIFEAAGGGGSGYACSRVCLKKGDTVVYVVGTVGLNSTATVNTTVSGESYTQLVVTPGGNGGSGNISTRRGGAAGAGGVGSGGNYSNLQGSAGEQGNTLGFKGITIKEGDSWSTAAMKGGAPGHSEGNYGGDSAYYNASVVGNTKHVSGGAGKPGFVKISAGNTNITVPDFPEQPESAEAYTLIDTYTTSQEWTTPEDGWYKVEVYGASGKGGSGNKSNGEVSGVYNYSSGSGGGGGGYAASIVKLNEGDILSLVCGAVGSDSTVTINPSYDTLRVTSGANGSNSAGNLQTVNGGAGGVGSGGNLENGTGSAGGKNAYKSSSAASLTGGTGGNPYNTEGNTGGNGANVSNGTVGYAGAGSNGFVKISRGNTNIVA